MQRSRVLFVFCRVLSLAMLLEVQANSNMPTNSSCAVQSDEIASLGCPAWFKLARELNGSCQCGDDVFPNLIQCNNATKVTRISTLFCATYDNSSGTVYSGRCLYNFMKDDKNALYEPLVTLPSNVSELNETMCGPLHRTGRLCSQCKDELGPPVLHYKSKCLSCLDSRYGWLVYILAAFGPTTVFCFVIMACRIDAASPTLNLMIMLSQIYINVCRATPALCFNIKHGVGAVMLGVFTFNGLWNLDVLRTVIPPFCLSSAMNGLQVLALDYLVAVYPLVITAVVYYCIEYHDRGCKVLVFLWKPFHPCAVRFRRTLDIKGTIINAFTTFFLLSYSKLLFISGALLGQVLIYDGCGETVSVVYYEPTIYYFSKPHLPYATLAIIILAVFVFLPLVYILFYQNRLFQRCLTACRLQSILFSELAKVCNRNYKDGINGTPDCRWYAGVYLVWRILLLILSEYILFYNSGLIGLPFIIVGVSGTVLCAFLQPYRKKCFNMIDTILLGTFTIVMLLALYPVNVHSHQSSFTVKAAIAAGAISIPPFYFICLAIFNLLKKIKSQSCFQTLVQAMNKLPFCKQNQDVVPYRLEHSSEYQPLLPPAAAGDTY